VEENCEVNGLNNMKRDWKQIKVVLTIVEGRNGTDMPAKSFVKF
jgi:hypothetical protein